MIKTFPDVKTTPLSDISIDLISTFFPWHGYCEYGTMSMRREKEAMMHITTPWNLVKKPKARKSHENVGKPFHDSTRSELSRREHHDSTYKWHTLSEMAGKLLGRKRGKGK